MVTRVTTVAMCGIKSKNVDVQVHIAPGLPGFNIVGLADKAVAESKDRIRASFQSIGLALPAKRITVNLAPANLMKEGSHYDLPIAMGLLAEMDIIPAEEIVNYIIMGELALDSSISSIQGALPVAMTALEQDKGFICPKQNYLESTWSGNKDILSADNMLELINHFNGKNIIIPPKLTPNNDNEALYPDFSDVKGQTLAKRAIEIAAAGGHNLLMIGPPGSGKSMLAKRLPGILPPLASEEILDISIISSISGVLNNKNSLQIQRPYRDPHCSASMPAMIGGGKNAKPGEITLAHNGVLFLDELPEFSRNVIESLRQPIETGYVTIARVNAHITYPARFQLIAAMNPCKCGYYGDINNACSRAPKCAQDYQNKISGPLFDRFDIRIDVVNNFDIIDYDNKQKIETSTVIKKRVIKAREIQSQRFKNQKNIYLNSHTEGDLLQNITLNAKENRDFVKNAVKKMQLSMRSVNRVLRVARTIADLYEINDVNCNHLSEALSYRIASLKA